MALLDHAAATYRGAEGFIDSLCTPDHAIISARDLAIIVAHPDDETIGCGAQLRRFREATIVVVTDGAPRNCDDARRHRLSGVEAYAARRFGELRRALALADVSERNVIVLGISDQTAALRLAELTHAIYYLLVQRKIGVVLTHAYEGGHPDHDATAFAVHTAAALRKCRGQPVSILEMPFYRAADAAWAVQTFVSCPGQQETTIRLTEDEQELKKRMFAAYVTQRKMLDSFSTEIEHFRPAPNYDFTSLPNGGLLLYERHQWGMTGKLWQALVGAALRELGWKDQPCP